jgi:hypothetical protein
MELLPDRYFKSVDGVISCSDRIVIRGTIPGLCYQEGMTSYLYSQKIKIFDYPRFAEPFKERIRENAEQISKQNKVDIQFIRKSHIRKEALVAEKIKERGNKPGLVAILSAMEACPSYKPWHDKKSGKTYLRSEQGKCLHYYFYFIDPELGLMYVRVPTWCPFGLQIYFNGHNWLANKLEKSGVKYSLHDNAFLHISDYVKAQKIADNFSVDSLHKKLDRFAKTYCPVFQDFGQVYHWSIMQAEYATDIVFHKPSVLEGMYDDLLHAAIHTVKPPDICSFLGKKLDARFEGEIGSNYHLRIEGKRVKHSMESASIKMYDKHGTILRIETTVNNVSFFKHYREVEHRDGSTSLKNAALKKNIYSLPALFSLLKDSNRRYLEFISAFQTNEIGRGKLKKITDPVQDNDRKYRGFNLFNKEDFTLLMTLTRGEFNIRGFSNKDLRKNIPEKSSGQVSRLLKNLRLHHLIKKVSKGYKYYLSKLGKELIITLGKIKEVFIIPELSLAAV